MSKQLQVIIIEASENLQSSKKKWTESQDLDELANAVQPSLVIIGIDLDSPVALEVIVFNLKGSTPTTYNQCRLDNA